jgi:hypothetical protein
MTGMPIGRGIQVRWQHQWEDEFKQDSNASGKRNSSRTAMPVEAWKRSSSERTAPTGTVIQIRQ